MRNFLLLIATASLPFLASAQLNVLLKDPNVTWAATFETEHDFRLNVKREKSSLQLTKFSYPEDGCLSFKNDNWLGQWILEAMSTDCYLAYEDAALTLPVPRNKLLNRISSIDTVITFDPNNYEERVQVIRNDMNADDIQGFRTSQVIYFDKKSGKFNTQLLALAPMVSMTDNQGNVVGKKPIAWLEMPKADSDLSVKNPDIIWSALLIDKANSLVVKDLNIKKDDRKKKLNEQILQEASSSKHPVEASGGYGCGEMLTQKDLQTMFSTIDTVITFDPETYKETVQVIKNDISPTDIKSVRLVQEWYYDQRRKVFANRLKALAPTVDVTDANGNFMYEKIMYYLHF